MCSGYSGQSGSGFQAFVRDKFGKGKSIASAFQGVSAGGNSGAGILAAVGGTYARRRNSAPALDTDMLGASGG